MLSKGLMIFIFGVILLIATLIWIFVDNKNKARREEELLSKVVIESSQGFNNTKSNTEMLSSTLDLNDETEILDNNLRIDNEEIELLNCDTEILCGDTAYLDDETELLVNN